MANVSPLVIICGILLLIGLSTGIYAFWTWRRAVKRIREARAANPPSEAVSFTAYYPKEVALEDWAPLLVFATSDEAAIREQVHTEARRELAVWQDEHPDSEIRETPPESGGRTVAHGEILRVVPHIEGFRINPPSATVAWEERWHKIPFRIMADTARPGKAVNGNVQIFIGPLLLAEIPISIYVDLAGVRPQMGDMTRETASAYRKIFASYSHHDSDIVFGCKVVGETLGDRYLMDVISLRSGEAWSKRLKKLLKEADVFQLFWSEHSSRSPFVRDEWRHALKLRRRRFIRPLYWTETPVEPIPGELRSLHFSKLDLSALNQRVQSAVIAKESASLSEDQPEYAVPRTNPYWVSYPIGAEPNASNAFVLTALSGVSVLLVLILCTSLLLVAYPRLLEATIVSTPTAQATPVPLAPAKTIVFCNDESGSYPVSYFQSAARKMADWVDQLVQPGQSGATVYVRYINSDSYSDSAYYLTIDVPKVDYAPAQPMLLPTPPPLNPPAQATATTATLATQTAYSDAKALVDKQLSDAKTSVQEQTNHLRQMPHPGSNSSDVWGCFQQATDLFVGTNGPKYLVIASDMQIAGPQQKMKVNLNGASVTVINYKSYDASSSYGREIFWTDALKGDHPGTIKFLDRETTSQIEQLFT